MLKSGDIVFIKSLKIEGMYMGEVVLLATKEKKSRVICGEEGVNAIEYVLDKEDLIFVSTLENALSKALEDDFATNHIC